MEPPPRLERGHPHGKILIPTQLDALDGFFARLATFLWDWPALWLIVSGGVFFTAFSRLVPFRYLGHSLAILRGKYDNPNDPGQINHFRALCSALSGTVGMGNIAGVAVAVSTGGPGALFWMWVCALLGMSTKFFTCTLSLLYRGKDDRGVVQGGPMYYIVAGLGPKWKPLAIMFASFGLVGALPLFQSNQLTSLWHALVFEPQGWFAGADLWQGNLLTGITIAALVGAVTLGGIERIGLVASRLVPAMVILYLGTGLVILVQHAHAIPSSLALIFHDAFTGRAVAGGALGTVITTGIRRGAFSNEAGLGTEALAHGAAKTKEPVREGLVAMLGPLFDTLIICTFTGLILLCTGHWQQDADGSLGGVILTKRAFEDSIPVAGPYLLLIAVLCFSFSTMITYSYYVTKCAVFLFGTRSENFFRLFYLTGIVMAAVVQMDLVLNILDSALALMAIPTTGAALLLAPRVMSAAQDYFARLDSPASRQKSS